MDDPPICPDYWPKLIWDLHFNIPGHHGPSPVNLPPYMNAIFAGLAVHTASYLMLDQQAAQNIRNETEQQLSKAILNLTKAHNEMMEKNRKG